MGTLTRLHGGGNFGRWVHSGGVGVATEQMIYFSTRKRLEELYKEWLKENPTVKDCPFNVITFLSFYLDEQKIEEKIGNPVLRKSNLPLEWMVSMERKTDCIFRLKATKFDYSQGGCKHTDMDGFICTAFASEGKAIFMVGLPHGCFCEMYSPREEQPPTEKQLEYAKYLAKRACQELPTEFTKSAYSDFISKWKPIVKKEDDEMNEPSSWQMQYL